MIKTDLLPYQECIELKKLGLNENEFSGLVTLYRAAQWFRDVHGLYVHSTPEFYVGGINFNWQILWYLDEKDWVYDDAGNPILISEGTFLYGDDGEYPTQEIADLSAIRKMIEIVKKRNHEIQRDIKKD